MKDVKLAFNILKTTTTFICFYGFINVFLTYADLTYTCTQLCPDKCS